MIFSELPVGEIFRPIAAPRHIFQKCECASVALSDWKLALFRDDVEVEIVPMFETIVAAEAKGGEP